MTYALITPPSAEPLTLAEVKAHLRLDGAEEDVLLLSLIRTARQFIERETGLCLITQSWRLYLDRWPRNGVIRLLRSPVQVIQSVRVMVSVARRFRSRLKIICSMARGGRRGYG